MKNKLFIKVGTIVILLLSLVVLMDGFQTNNSSNNFYQANALSTGGSKVQLKINEGAITCTGWLSLLDMGAVNAGFGAQVASGTYALSGWNCLDTKGSSTRGFTIRITGDLYGGLGGSTISSGLASICIISAPTKMQGTTLAALSTTIPVCASTTGLVITQDLMRRPTANGEIFQYQVQPKILVSIPASQAPGVYTGVLEISIP